jgi:hypothetical protein
LSIDHLKKQAKSLRKLFPDFVQEHSTSPSLAACQELVARCRGYPSWHSAVKALEAPLLERSWDAAHQQRVSTLRSHLAWSVTRGDPDSDTALREGFTSVRLEIIHGSNLSGPEDQLDDFLERHPLDGTGPSAPSVQTLHEFTSLCNRAIADAPGFIDGHAHLVSALTMLGQPKDAFSHGRPILDALIEMLPNGSNFVGRISWYELSNRPVHRLAYNVASAYLANREEGEGFKLRAEELVTQFLGWWPNDNNGMSRLIGLKR